MCFAQLFFQRPRGYRKLFGSKQPSFFGMHPGTPCPKHELLIAGRLPNLHWFSSLCKALGPFGSPHPEPPLGAGLTCIGGVSDVFRGLRVGFLHWRVGLETSTLQSMRLSRTQHSGACWAFHFGWKCRVQVTWNQTLALRGSMDHPEVPMAKSHQTRMLLTCLRTGGRRMVS